MTNKILMKLDDFVSDLNEVEDVMWWVECPDYQSEVLNVKAEDIEDNDGRLVKHISFYFDGVSEDVWDNLREWNQLIIELSDKEVRLYQLKDEYQALSDEIIEATDFKALYGKNNAEVRKNHVRNELADEHQAIKELEFRIDYIARRLSYLKAIVHAKTVLMEAKKQRDVEP